MLVGIAGKQRCHGPVGHALGMFAAVFGQRQQFRYGMAGGQCNHPALADSGRAGGRRRDGVADPSLGCDHLDAVQDPMVPGDARTQQGRDAAKYGADQAALSAVDIPGCLRG